MNPNEEWRAERTRLVNAMPVLKARGAVLRAIRDFFADRGFTEVESPVRIAAPASEPHIDAESAGDAYLRTSPELHMKRLLAAGYDRIFQMGPCFRQNERGLLHNPEYTMLEWYRADADYLDILADAKALLVSVAEQVLGRTSLTFRACEIDLSPIWEFMTVSDAFVRFAGWNPVLNFDADRFDVDLVSQVEPRLPKGCPVVLANYPAEASALARLKPGNPRVAERWELYVGGIELANAFSELTDPVEQRQRFVECAAWRRAVGKPVYPSDEVFLSALADMPPSAGVAMGIDRLVMLLTDSPSLDAVIPFRIPVG